VHFPRFSAYVCRTTYHRSAIQKLLLTFCSAYHKLHGIRRSIRTSVLSIMAVVAAMSASRERGKPKPNSNACCLLVARARNKWLILSYCYSTSETIPKEEAMPRWWWWSLTQSGERRRPANTYQTKKR